mmetsp:Transcript_39653/g.122610  ORF Transcript_39653/g.122610 Transcript_39653/m.122610 type:complete len:214 (-) Transcript_39653:630-1271(-)
MCTPKVTRSSLKRARLTAVTTSETSVLLSLAILASVSESSSASARARRKRLRNMASENWYMWLRLRKSLMRKKAALPFAASGRYTSRFSSSSTERVLDFSRASSIVCAFVLSWLSDSMSVLFSSSDPFDVARSRSSESSSSASCSLRPSSCFSSSTFCCSSSGCSLWIVTPSSCPSRPPRVMVNEISLRCAAMSGGRRMSVDRVSRKSWKESA